MSLVSWIVKKKVKDVFKGSIQAVQDLLGQLLTYLDNREETSSAPTTALKVDNNFPTEKELAMKALSEKKRTVSDDPEWIKRKAHDALKGMR